MDEHQCSHLTASEVERWWTRVGDNRVAVCLCCTGPAPAPEWLGEPPICKRCAEVDA